MRQFDGRLENAFFLQEKHMSIKFLVLGFFLGGGGSADFIFMGARIFLMVCQTYSLQLGGLHEITETMRTTKTAQTATNKRVEC